MAIENLKPMGHYALDNHPTIYDEESLTALELCARTASKMNETIELLLKECKEQNLTIDQAVEYMKDHLDESTSQLLYSMAQNGELDILTQENFEAIRKNIVPIANVREYGATGDGVTDDTEAFKSAIATASVIYVPKGIYNVTSTLEIPTYKHIYGEGPTDTILKYTGTGYLFDVKTNYAQRAVLEKLQCTGSADFANSFIKVSTGRWGASVAVRDFRVLRFSGEVIRLESAFDCVFEDMHISANGKSVITTFDGTETNMNFSNCNLFKNVYYGKFDDARIPVMFELFNVRQLSFYNCQLERADVIFQTTGKVTRLTCLTNWFEDVGALYQFSDQANPPVFYKCTYVRVDKYNGYADGIDRIPGGDSEIRVYDGSTRTAIDLRDGEEQFFFREWVNNPNDTYSSTWFPFKISTKESFFKHPVNTVTVEKKNSVNIAYCLNDITNYALINGYFDVKFLCYFSDASCKALRKRVYAIRGKFLSNISESDLDCNWGLANQTTTFKISLDANTGTVTGVCDSAPALSVLTVEYHFNHAKGDL